MSGPLNYESLVKPDDNDDVTAPIVCPKCGSPMEMGTIAQQNGFSNLAGWFFHVGKFRRRLIGYSFTSHGEYPLVPCRCVRCGLVEFYAPKQ